MPADCNDFCVNVHRVVLCQQFILSLLALFFFICLGSHVVHNYRCSFLSPISLPPTPHHIYIFILNCCPSIVWILDSVTALPSFLRCSKITKVCVCVCVCFQQQKSLEGYVGFVSLPNQVYRKSVKRGFEFTLMVVGESGLGKSTLINSLFLTDLYSGEYPGPAHRVKKTVQVEQSKVLLKEGGVQLLLTIVDTPGFGDAVDNSNCWQPVIDYIDSKFEDYLNAESRVNRRQMPDSRVHSCLYFIAPSGHGLKPLDIEFMKRLHEKVNIIPLIAKADTLTPEECQQFKKQIMHEIQEHKIKIYEFPETYDEEENKLVKKIKERLPLAVVGSNTIIEVNGKKVRGRQYPWGVAEVENGEHCDFTILRNMLIRTHMQDLKDVTNDVHYENYRSRKLAAVTYNGVDNNKSKGQLTKSPLAQMEEERRDHVAKMKKMEMEMEQVFEMKVKEKVQKLKDSEAELQRRHEQMKKNLEAQHKELEEKRRQFEEDRANWESQQRLLEQQNSEMFNFKVKHTNCPVLSKYNILQH
uniref:Septin-7 n=1 Tax=Denticeps clupeoides TaxID=299321 RepID=A0AAY4ARS9_9TELE